MLDELLKKRMGMSGGVLSSHLPQSGLYPNGTWELLKDQEADSAASWRCREYKGQYLTENLQLSFPGGSVVKNPSGNAGDSEFDP